MTEKPEAAVWPFPTRESEARRLLPQGLPAPVGVSDERIEALADRHCRILSNIEWNGRWAFDIKALLSFARALLAEAVLPPQGQSQAVAFAGLPPDSWYRHVKRGTVYALHDVATLQTEKPLEDGADLFIYQGLDKKLYARTPAEFMDGRFEATEPPQGRDNPPPNAPQGQATPSTNQGANE